MGNNRFNGKAIYNPSGKASIAIGLVIFIQDAPIIAIIVIARKV